MTNVALIIKKIKKLQPIPVVIHKIIASLDNPDSSLGDLVELIERDPAITANLLKICNSAHFGLVAEVDSIQRAVALLGAKRIAELVLTHGLSQNLNLALEGYSLAKGELWKQSVAGAMMAKSLSERRQLDNQPAIYTAALLRDIGKVILHEYVADALGDIQQMVRKEGLSFIEAEKACIGVDHAALGAMIAKHWNFGPQLTYMIENHHLNDRKARNHAGTSTLYWADMVAMMVGTGMGVDRLAYHVYDDSFDELSLSKDELRTLMLMYKSHLQGAARLFEIQ